MNKSNSILVLNADLTPIARVDLNHAIRMIVRQVAEIHEALTESFGPFLRPKVLRLVRYVATKWQWTSVPGCTRARVLKRDSRKCGFCGSRAATVDHLTPKSRGGKDTWANLVSACLTCNNKKANKTPAEAGMKLLFEPRQPTWAEILGEN